LMELTSAALASFGSEQPRVQRGESG